MTFQRSMSQLIRSEKVFMLLRSVIFAVLVLMVGAQVAQPQLPTASFRGTVVDSGGAAVTGAKLRLQNTTSGVLERDLQTDESGSFSAETLPPGSYHVEIAKDGFATQTQSIELLVGRVLVVNFTLSVQAVRQSVTVNATTPLVDPESSEVGGDVEPRAVASLPLNGRQFGELATLVPGVLPAPNFDPIKTRILNVSAEGSDGHPSVRSLYSTSKGVNRDLCITWASSSRGNSLIVCACGFCAFCSVGSSAWVTS